MSAAIDAAARIGWYLKRARRTLPGEHAWRISDAAARRRWERRAPNVHVAVRPDRPPFAPLGAVEIPSAAEAALAATAAEIRGGRWTVLGWDRSDLARPDWDADGAPRGLTDLDGSPPAASSVKHVWELSRGHHLTVLAAASRFDRDGDKESAERAAELTRQWWEAYPAPAGMMWSSGVELALRLMSWVWTRRLLDDWPPVRALFDDNDLAHRHLWLHQDALARFPSRFSSANNHRLAEAAGLLCASAAFDWFPESDGWRTAALATLCEEINAQVAPSGATREQATGYHAFVLDLSIVALAEAATAGLVVPAGVIDRLAAGADALALIVGTSPSGPRFGDADDSTVARLDGGEPHTVRRALALAAATLGPAVGWPEVEPDVRSATFGAFSAGALARRDDAEPRPRTDRETLAASIGPAVLDAHGAAHRARAWVRTGPLGYLPIAAHAHADLGAVAFELDDVPLLVDPGTSVYDHQPERRRHERSTAAHNTVSIGGDDQAPWFGSFLWGGEAEARVAGYVAEPVGDRPAQVTTRIEWPAHGCVHERTVSLDEHRLVIEDRLDAMPGASKEPRPIGVCHTIGSGWSIADRLRTLDDGTQVATMRHDDLRVQFHLSNALAWGLVDAVGNAGVGWVATGFGRLEPSMALIGASTLPVGCSTRMVVSWEGSR